MLKFKRDYIVSVFTGLLALSTALPVLAQTFDAQPITFDLSEGADAAGGLLVVAFEPSAAAPQVARANGADQSAILFRAGYPRPSIIVGRIASGMEAALGIERLMPETVAQFGFAYDDLEAREALRESNPDMFRQLVQEGHIDPPEAELANVVQRELQRMNCYRSRIDGDWGTGSRRAARQYFTTLGQSSGGLDATASADLFRAVVLGGDVTCVVAAAPARTTPRTTQPSRPSQPAKPAPATNSGPSLSGGGIGVFR